MTQDAPVFDERRAKRTRLPPRWVWHLRSSTLGTGSRSTRPGMPTFYVLRLQDRLNTLTPHHALETTIGGELERNNFLHADDIHA